MSRDASELLHKGVCGGWLRSCAGPPHRPSQSPPKVLYSKFFFTLVITYNTYSLQTDITLYTNIEYISVFTSCRFLFVSFVLYYTKSLLWEGFWLLFQAWSGAVHIDLRKNFVKPTGPAKSLQIYYVHSHEQNTWKLYSITLNYFLQRTFPLQLIILSHCHFTSHWTPPANYQPIYGEQICYGQHPRPQTTEYIPTYPLSHHLLVNW